MPTFPITAGRGTEGKGNVKPPHFTFPSIVIVFSSTVIVTTPAFASALSTTYRTPPQQGTSMRRTRMDLTGCRVKISASFSI